MAKGILFKSENARLITRTSSDRAGIGDYVVKRDFRRDVDQDIVREGFDYFWPNKSGAFASNPLGQPFPNGADTSEALSLIHLARRPNGRHAIIVGTKTKLWRFFGNEDGDYCSDDYFEPVTGDPVADAAAFRPYVAVTNEQWMLIGSGFSTAGHRWEAININGYTALNNGVDLPMTYRLEDAEVEPIYELREQGIACVGTIGETNGILMCGDISEIHTEEFLTLMRPLGDIVSGNVTASKASASIYVTTPADFFDSTYIGRTVVFNDGTTAVLQADGGNTARQMKVDYDVATAISNQTFTLRNTATQSGATFSSLITASVAVPTGLTVVASANIFSAPMVGKLIRFANGFSALITAFTSGTQVTIDASPAEAIDSLPFWVSDVITDDVNDPAYSTSANDKLTASAPVFTNDMVGRSIVFDSGETRQILKVYDSQNVKVDSDGSIAGEFFQMDNPSSFGAFTNDDAVDRVQYRTLWAMPDEPRRFGSIVPGTVNAGEQVVSLQFPVKSLEAGQEIIITGAGIDGGNLTANILSVSGLGNTLLIDAPAVTSVTEKSVEQSDANGSIVGFEDLQDDSSAILRILSLSDVLIIYKETCIFTAVFTGSTDNPFSFTRLELPKAVNLVYRWTLVNVGGLFHVYASANAFYRFDLASRVPRPIQPLEMVSDIFFSQISLAVTNNVFGANNAVTNEVVFSFPSTSADKTLWLDYTAQSASTSAIAITAAATVKRPADPNEQVEDLFLLGNSQGTVLVYGWASVAQPSWTHAVHGPDGGFQIFYQRYLNPFDATEQDYSAVLKTGLGDFGDPNDVKDVTAYVLYLGSQSPDARIDLNFYGARNPNEAPTLLFSEAIQHAQLQNLIPMFYRNNYFQMELNIFSVLGPVRIIHQSYDVSLVGTGSDSAERRVTA